MAKTVYDSEEIVLQDGTEVTLVPLPIGRLKKFMKAWEQFENMEGVEDTFDIYVNCCGIALEKVFADKFDKRLDTETFITEEYREYLEDVLDMDTIFKVIEVCGGLDLKKMMEEVERQALAAQAEAAGPTLTSLP